MSSTSHSDVLYENWNSSSSDNFTLKSIFWLITACSINFDEGQGWGGGGAASHLSISENKIVEHEGEKQVTSFKHGLLYNVGETFHGNEPANVNCSTGNLFQRRSHMSLEKNLTPSLTRFTRSLSRPTTEGGILQRIRNFIFNQYPTPCFNKTWWVQNAQYVCS